jgi:hypothetical protein
VCACVYNSVSELTHTIGGWRSSVIWLDGVQSVHERADYSNSRPMEHIKNPKHKVKQHSFTSGRIPLFNKHK